jgi:hypothetical protein
MTEWHGRLVGIIHTPSSHHAVDSPGIMVNRLPVVYEITMCVWLWWLLVGGRGVRE